MLLIILGTTIFSHAALYFCLDFATLMIHNWVKLNHDTKIMALIVKYMNKGVFMAIRLSVHATMLERMIAFLLVFFCFLKVEMEKVFVGMMSVNVVMIMLLPFVFGMFHTLFCLKGVGV